MARWEQETPEESYRFAVQSFFEPTDFLRTLRATGFSSTWRTAKRGKPCCASTQRRRGRPGSWTGARRRAKRRGLIWHTQGSEKTFTLLTAARLILEDKDSVWRTSTVVVVGGSDRELEGQLKPAGSETAAGRDAATGHRRCGECGHEGAFAGVASANDTRGLIISMIHEVRGHRKATPTPSDSIYVFIDEAHRSVAKDLGYLPNGGGAELQPSWDLRARAIARTEHGEGTFKIFGVDDELGVTWTGTPFAESIEDETTLPIRHMMAPSEMSVPAESARPRVPGASWPMPKT